MKLSEYLKLTGQTDAAFAKSVNRERSTVTRWKLNQTRPDWDALAEIERETKGAVTYRDFASAETAA